VSLAFDRRLGRGPDTRCRTHSGTAIFSILNAMTQLMYAVTTVIVGAQALRSINHDVSLVVGIVILTVVVALLCIWGYQFLHLWERYAWIVCFIIYCIVLGLGTRGQYDVHAGTAEMATARELQGNVLSFLGIMFSVGSGWTSIAADYNMTLPHTTPTWAIWVSSFVGMYLPIAFTCSVSATFNILTAPDYVSAFEEESLGGVVGHILITNAGGFGKFLMVLLAFSTVSANIPNTYSGALCLQTLHPWLMKIPRIFFVIGFAAIYLVVALVGREHFSEILSNFSAILACESSLFQSAHFPECTPSGAHTSRSLHFPEWIDPSLADLDFVFADAITLPYARRLHGLPLRHRLYRSALVPSRERSSRRFQNQLGRRDRLQKAATGVRVHGLDRVHDPAHRLVDGRDVVHGSDRARHQQTVRRRSRVRGVGGDGDHHVFRVPAFRDSVLWAVAPSFGLQRWFWVLS
jgi:hypothetical protein